MSEEQVADPNVLSEPQVFEMEIPCASGELKMFRYTANTIQELQQLRPNLEQFRSVN
jgi:hypothetical protein